MMKRTALVLLSLLACAAPAQALKLIVWDNELQTKLGAGESSGNKFNVQLVKDYSGPVKIIFSQSADEKAKGLFPGLQSSYDGMMKNGQLTLLTSPGSSTPKSTTTTPTAGTTASSAQVQAASANGLTLTKFLQQFKLNVVNQTTGQNDPEEESSTKNGNANGNNAAALEAAPGQNKDKKKP